MSQAAPRRARRHRRRRRRLLGPISPLLPRRQPTRRRPRRRQRRRRPRQQRRLQVRRERAHPRTLHSIYSHTQALACRPHLSTHTPTSLKSTYFPYPSIEESSIDTATIFAQAHTRAFFESCVVSPCCILVICRLLCPPRNVFHNWSCTTA